MNFYKHHLGDYDSATSHLSWLEDMAYSRLIRLYYRTERPIPSDLSQACRLVRAITKTEREAVKTVLSEFFSLFEDGWHQDRCDTEISAAQRKGELNREVGKLGGRPSKNKTIMVLQTEPNDNHDGLQTEPNDNHDGLQTEPNNNPSQTPDTRHQTPDSNKELLHTLDNSESASACVSVPIGLAGSVCKTLMQDGIQGCNPHNPTLLALLEAGATIDEFRYAATSAKDKTKPFNYLLGTVKRQREEAAKLVLHQGRLPQKINGNNVQEARLLVAQQIMGGTNGTHGKIIDVTPAGSDSSDRARIPEAVDGVWEPADGQVARH